MHVSPNPSLTRSALPGILHATLAGSKHGLQGLSVWTQILEAGSATPPHRHDCEEVLLCSGGRGELRIGERSLPFGADSTVTIPRNALHQIVNVGVEPLRIVAIFSRSPVEAFFPDGQRIDLPWAS
jgi:mannose-6-phosphate isomerase-like protein (cupin superfamily)